MNNNNSPSKVFSTEDLSIVSAESGSQKFDRYQDYGLVMEGYQYTVQGIITPQQKEKITHALQNDPGQLIEHTRSSMAQLMTAFYMNFEEAADFEFTALDGGNKYRISLPTHHISYQYPGLAEKLCITLLKTIKQKISL